MRFASGSSPRWSAASPSADSARRWWARSSIASSRSSRAGCSFPGEKPGESGRSGLKCLAATPILVKQLFSHKDFSVTDADFASSTPPQPVNGDGAPSDGAEPRIAELEAQLAAANAQIERLRAESLCAKAE